MDKMYKISIYTNFPLTPTPGYLKFFETIFSMNKFELVDINNPLSSDISISFNHTKENLDKIISSGIPIRNRILIMLESKQILPEMHLEKVLKEYGHIFSPSKNWANGFNKIIFKYPFCLSTTENTTALSERQFDLGIIQRNKFSCIKGELYTLRRSVIKKIGYDNIVVRGEDWNKPLSAQFVHYLKILRYYLRRVSWSNIVFLPRYLIKNKEFTPVKNKQNFLSQVKVALVIENSADYVSEKIFDCFRAGTVPIYVGPLLADFGIPINTAIQCEPNIDSLLNTINKIKSFDLEQIASNGWEFLKSSGREWDESQSMKRLAEHINAMF